MNEYLELHKQVPESDLKALERSEKRGPSRFELRALRRRKRALEFKRNHGKNTVQPLACDVHSNA